MGNMIGILSTVILVSTLATLIFAVGAYIIARRRRDASPSLADEMEAPPPRAPSLPPLEEAVHPEPEPELHVEPPKPATKAPPRAADASAFRRAPAPTPASSAEPGSDGPLFRKLTIRGEAPARGEPAPAEETREQNWE